MCVSKIYSFQCMGIAAATYYKYIHTSGYILKGWLLPYAQYLELTNVSGFEKGPTSRRGRIFIFNGAYLQGCNSYRLETRYK